MVVVLFAYCFSCRFIGWVIGLLVRFEGCLSSLVLICVCSLRVSGLFCVELGVCLGLVGADMLGRY